MDEYH